MTREGSPLKTRRLLAASIPVLIATTFAMVPLQAGAGSGVGNIPPGTQRDEDYRQSYAMHEVTNVSATTQKVSCYRPEVPFFTVGQARGYTGMTACSEADATTGEDIGLTAFHSSRKRSMSICGSRPWRMCRVDCPCQTTSAT